MPQAVYWLDRLGCVREVLAEAKGCIKGCDLYLDGRHLLTGRFPDDTPYPDFALLVVRRRFNEIMQAHAVASGARFAGGIAVRGVVRDGEVVRVFADAGRKAVEHRARIVIGADGASSAVSRSIGNNLKDGVLGLSVRTTYAGVKCDAGIRVYFNRDYFPSYGWMFIDEHQTACVGVGCAVDPKFPPTDNLGSALRQFINSDLKVALADARRIGPFSGGIAPHFRPEAMTADGVLLIGDAACQADPLNRGGIHTAIESAFYAAAAAALRSTPAIFPRNARPLRSAVERTQRARLAHLRDLHVAGQKPGPEGAGAVPAGAGGNPRRGRPPFGLRQRRLQRSGLPVELAERARPFPGRAQGPCRLGGPMRENSKSKASVAAGSVRFLAGAIASAARGGAGLARRPGASLDWALEVLTKAATFADRRLSAPRAVASPEN